jgi:aminoglycoside 3-N-acetyltransferase
MMHCSLSAVGEMAGGPDALLDGVLAALAPSGTLMMPVMPDPAVPIDLRSSPGTVGRVGEALRLRAGVLRSNHPTHSVVAFGAAAEFLVTGHKDTSPCGPGSPYEKLARSGGWVLLLGVDLDRCTLMHTAEDLSNVPYLQTIRVHVLGGDGRAAPVVVERVPNGHRAFISLSRQLRQAGIVRLGRIGNAVVSLLPARELLDFGVELLAREPAAFLCCRPRCVSCLWARDQLCQSNEASTEPVDWAQRSVDWGCSDPQCEVCYV